VDTTTIRHCWHKASIVPAVEPPTPVEPTIPVSSLLIAGRDNDCNQIDPIRNAEKQVESALDELVSTGALQQGNRMDIEALLNPVDESHVVDEVTDEEIFHAVIDARNAQEDGPINGGDDDIDDNASIEACPTRREVLQAATVISQYVDSVDGPLARKLEMVLASFGRQMRLEESRSMVPTRLTDFFSPK
jgi:hypothetical protein